MSAATLLNSLQILKSEPEKTSHNWQVPMFFDGRLIVDLIQSCCDSSFSLVSNPSVVMVSIHLFLSLMLNFPMVLWNFLSLSFLLGSFFFTPSTFHDMFIGCSLKRWQKLLFHLLRHQESLWHNFLLSNMSRKSQHQPQVQVVSIQYHQLELSLHMQRLMVIEWLLPQKTLL